MYLALCMLTYFLHWIKWSEFEMAQALLIWAIDQQRIELNKTIEKKRE